MKKILIATANPHKLAEIKKILEGSCFELVSLSDFDNIKEPEENGGSYFENARIKAVSYSKQAGLLAVADDTGLEIDFFGGAPGIYSARYISDTIEPAKRNEIILEKMAGCENRQARFVCTVVLADGDNVLCKAEGELKGEIAKQAFGGHGFGYDPIFYIPECGKTLAEVTENEKNKISHRARAFCNFVELSRDFLR